jgi:hypothetical protein
MKLKDIFQKPIDRTIEGVIKADDLASLQLEVEEYVITNEVAKSLETFFDSYNNYRNANGVWISGFFGSGKSHLLKMISLLLENREINGKEALDYFLPKCRDNAILIGEMKRAAAIPSRSILFNIDQKADTISKKEVDAVLAVFVKVFNEMCGYYGKQGYVAQFERDLDNRGLYEDFKKAYEKTAGKPWEKGREEIILEKGNIAKAYSQVSGTKEDTNKNIIDAYRNDYKLSIEDFADQVHTYIKKQGPDFRLNFFVDEVGQYIADNVKLMTNLQTIAESLDTKCKGRAWLIVTAQSDMDLVLGEMGKQMTADFSKIQDRFKIRLKLTSQNVDEVIQKRLLKKNEKGGTLAEKIYDKEKNNFGTLFDFTDGAQTYRNFTSKQHFTDCYPFPQYQFTLFQRSIESLSKHAAFEGRHSSVGERSMLGVFQHVVKLIGDREVGQLATFDLMFEGIKATLKPFITSSLYKADNNLGDPFAIRVLKALLLVKYIKGFNATPKNLRVLMQETFDQNVPKLLKQIQDALNLLELQTYIQRNGETYEYLTDEEKDVEEEIKTTEVDAGEVAKILEDILFAGIIKDNKIRLDTGLDYPYTKKLDDRIAGREHELTVHFVTPFSEYVDNINALKSHSLGRPELLVVLPNDTRFYSDLNLYKKTEKYIRVTRSSKQNDTILGILDNKGRQNEDRLALVQERAKELVGKARLFVSGEEVEISGEEPKTRILKSFGELVVKTYPSLRMLGSKRFEETDVRKYLDISKDALMSEQPSEPEQEVLAFIQGNRRVGTRTTLKGVEEKFSKKPYGWYLTAIQCVTAMLLGRGKIEAKVDSNILDGAELEQALKNTYGFSNVILEPQADVKASELRRVKDFFSNFFDKPASTNEAKALGVEIREALQAMLANLRELHVQVHEYPFLSVLEKPIHALQELTGKDYAFYFEELPKQENALLDMKEDVIDPLRQFMKGANRAIYDEARKFMQAQSPNFSAMESEKPAQLQAILEAPDCFKGNKMKDAKALMGELKKEMESHVKQARKEALAHVDKIQGQVQGMQEYSALKKEQKQEIEQSFEAIQAYIQNETLISSIRDRAGRYETADYNSLLTKITSWTQKPDDKPVEFVSQADLGVKFEKPYLASEEDVDAYLEAVKKAMLKAIKGNKRIQL